MPSGTIDQFLVTNNLSNTTWSTFNTTTKFTGNGISTPLNIATDAITTTEILNGTIATVDIADGAITNPKLATGSVGTLNIIDGSITTPKIADNAITTLKILDGTIGTLDIADGAITNPKLADASVTPAKIQPGTDDYVIKTVGGNVTWAPDDFTIPIDKLYAVDGDMFKLTRTAGNGNIFVGINNGASGNAGRFESTNSDPTLVAINYNNTGAALYAEKNTSTANQYVAEIINSNINLGRSLNVQNNAPYPTGWVIGSLDPTDVVEAALVVNNNNTDPNKPAIKTYGDIIANSNVVASEFYAVNQITVGDVNTGLFTTITPPTVLGGPIDINSGANIYGDLFVDGDITAQNNSNLTYI